MLHSSSARTRAASSPNAAGSCSASVSAHAPIVASGLFTSCITPAASWPTAASFSACAARACARFAVGDVLADGDHVRHREAVHAHRDLRHAVHAHLAGGARFHLELPHAPVGEHFVELAAQQIGRLAPEDVEDRASHREIAPHALRAGLARAVPCVHAVFAVHDVETEREGIHDPGEELRVAIDRRAARQRRGDLVRGGGQLRALGGRRGARARRAPQALHRRGERLVERRLAGEFPGDGGDQVGAATTGFPGRPTGRASGQNASVVIDSREATRRCGTGQDDRILKCSGRGARDAPRDARTADGPSRPRASRGASRAPRPASFKPAFESPRGSPHWSACHSPPARRGSRRCGRPCRSGSRRAPSRIFRDRARRRPARRRA